MLVILKNKNMEHTDALVYVVRKTDKKGRRDTAKKSNS